MFRRRRDNAPDWPEYVARQARVCRTPALRQFYQGALPATDTAIGDAPLMALDLETTGLDPDGDAIVSIGLIPFSLDGIRPSAGRYWVVKPSRPLREASIAFHRITHSQIADAPPLERIFPQLLDCLAGHVPVVHYRHIERPFLDNAARRLYGERCLFPVIDTMALEARWQREGRRQRLKRWLGLGAASLRLGDSRARYGLPAYSAHHAKVDALATAELFLAQMARYYGPETQLGHLWT